MRGWVYVISNPTIPGLVKIGFSTKDPLLRAEELNHRRLVDDGLLRYFTKNKSARWIVPACLQPGCHKRSALMV